MHRSVRDLLLFLAVGLGAILLEPASAVLATVVRLLPGVVALRFALRYLRRPRHDRLTLTVLTCLGLGGLAYLVSVVVDAGGVPELVLTAGWLAMLVGVTLYFVREFSERNAQGRDDESGAGG